MDLLGDSSHVFEAADISTLVVDFKPSYVFNPGSGLALSHVGCPKARGDRNQGN